MSGRKDYSYTRERQRQAALEAAIAAQQAQRAEATRRRLQLAKEESRRRMQTVQNQRRAATKERLRKAAEEAAQQVAQLQAEAEARSREEQRRDDGQAQRLQEVLKLAEEAGVDEQVIQESTSEFSRLDQQDSNRRQAVVQGLETACQEQKELTREQDAQMEMLGQWQQSLTDSEETKSFGGDRYETWKSDVEQLFGGVAQQRATRQSLQRIQQAVVEAESIEQASGQVADQYQSRNEVMVDIMESLKEIGFFVQNPEFADASDPSGSVVIRAQRGNQLMTAEVDLDSRVRSDWQGIHGEHCTGAFFEYVKAMGDRGIEITPDDPALKPRLIKKGELDLPTQNEQQRGGS